MNASAAGRRRPSLAALDPGPPSRVGAAPGRDARSKNASWLLPLSATASTPAADRDALRHREAAEIENASAGISAHHRGDRHAHADLLEDVRVDDDLERVAARRGGAVRIDRERESAGSGAGRPTAVRWLAPLETGPLRPGETVQPGGAPASSMWKLSEDT